MYRYGVGYGHPGYWGAWWILWTRYGVSRLLGSLGIVDAAAGNDGVILPDSSGLSGVWV